MNTRISRQNYYKEKLTMIMTYIEYSTEKRHFIVQELFPLQHLISWLVNVKQSQPYTIDLQNNSQEDAILYNVVCTLKPWKVICFFKLFLEASGMYHSSNRFAAIWAGFWLNCSSVSTKLLELSIFLCWSYAMFDVNQGQF